MPELSSAEELRRNGKRTRTGSAAGIAPGAGKPLSAVGVRDGPGPD
jgi:hypothetical protein